MKTITLLPASRNMNQCWPKERGNFCNVHILTERENFIMKNKEARTTSPFKVISNIRSIKAP